MLQAVIDSEDKIRRGEENKNERRKIDERIKPAERENVRARIVQPVLDVARLAYAPFWRLWKFSRFLLPGVDNLSCPSYSCKVVWTPLCWTGRPCSLTIDTMCQNPFETIRLSSPNG